MTLIEVYLASTALLALIIGLANFRHSCKRQEVDMVAAQAAHKMAEALASHADAIRDLREIKARHAEEIADLRTRVLALSKRDGK